MMKSSRVFSFFFLVALTAAAQTGTNMVVSTNMVAGRPMSLLDCIKESLSHNFDVQIERYNPQIALYTLNAYYSGYDPTFNLSGQRGYNKTGIRYQNGQIIGGSAIDDDTFNSGINGGTPWGMTYNLSGNIGDSSGNQYGISNSLPIQNSSGTISLSAKQPLLKNSWIDSTRLNIRVAKNRLKYSEQGLRLQLITSVTDVINAYYELIFAQQNVQVQQEALNLSQTQLDQDQQRVKIGTLAILSVQQDESQVAQNRASLISAQSTLDTAENTLKSLLTDRYSQWHDMDIQPTATLEAPPQSFDLQKSWDAGLNQRPDLVQAKLNVEEQGIELKYYRNQLYPELDLIGSYGFNGSGNYMQDTFRQFGEGNQPTYYYGASLTMPLSNVGARNQYKSTKATLQQVLLQLKQFEQNVMVQIDNAVKTAESKFESVQATRQARIYAEIALDAQQKTYAVGKATTFEVLTYQNNLTAARSAEIRALADYNEALAALAKQEGTTLEQYNVDLQAK